jgi:hypothetical protein
VIVVVLFTALVDNIVDRREKVGLACKEWLGLDLCGEM